MALISTEVLAKPVASSRRFSLNHPGIDYLAPKRTPVKARFPGKLIKNGINPKGQDFGNYCVVSYSGLKFQGWSAHLDKFLVKAGTMVKKGQIIALSGNSGYVLPKPSWWNPNAGSHLHYTESTKGTTKWLNPDKTTGPKPAKAPSRVYYVVKAGDTLSKISNAKKVSILKLINLNKTKYPSLPKNPGLIQIGWKLRIK